MNGTLDMEENRPVAQHRVAELMRALADPAHRSGGGVAAAVTLASAAATAELVFALAERRKSLRERRTEIAELRDKISRLGEQMFEAAEQDMAAFTELMDAQAAVRHATGEQDRQEAQRLADDALHRAAETPISVSLDGLHLLQMIHHGLGFANRFTISDLGAAAALASGAIEAALLTADVNLSYMDKRAAAELSRKVASIREEAPSLSAQILRATSEGIG